MRAVILWQGMPFFNLWSDMILVHIMRVQKIYFNLSTLINYTKLVLLGLRLRMSGPRNELSIATLLRSTPSFPPRCSEQHRLVSRAEHKNRGERVGLWCYYVAFGGYICYKHWFLWVAICCMRCVGYIDAIILMHCTVSVVTLWC